MLETGFFFFEIRIFNERCAKWVNYAPKAYGNVPSCLVSVAFIQGMFVLQRNYIVSLCKPLQLQLCFTGIVVEELPTRFPCFTKHYKDAANKNLLLQSVNMERRAGTLINF